ncbi:MAG TPA: response regulator [Sphingobium sp.]
MADNPSTTILLVEDEALIRMLGVIALEDAGFTVLEAVDADDAMRLLGDDGGDICLLFSDIDMPGDMNGLALARLVHDRWPDIRLLLTSGHHHITGDRIPQDGRFMSKPWREEVLVAEVNALLHP